MPDPIRQDVCSSCGAKLPDGAALCELCGTPAGSLGEPEPVADTAEDPVTPPVMQSPAGPFCNDCGWKNPEGARFCSRCGARLQDTAPAQVGSPMAGSSERLLSAEPASVQRRVGLIVAGAVLLVAALFLVTVASKNGQRPAPMATQATAPAEGEHQSAPLAPETARQAEALEAEIETLGGSERVSRRRALVDLFVGAGRMDRAAEAQVELAREAGSPEAWVLAGDLLSQWMETIQGTHKSEVALRAVEAYKKALEGDPENLDARTNMAWAYQYDPQNAMEAITQTNLVLEKNPEHVRANFNKGIFLIQINRVDHAIAQFERVKQLAGEGTLEYDRAEAVLGAIADMRRQPAS